MYPYKSLSSAASPASSRSFFRSMTAAFGHLSQAVMNKLLDVMEIYRQRRAQENLDDRLLKDIGLTRCDVEREVARPVWR